MSDLGLYALLFLAFWTVPDAMFGMAVMAAAVPGVHDGDDQHARPDPGSGEPGRQHRRQILVDWPAAQMSLGMIPWIVSLWTHDPTRRCFVSGCLAAPAAALGAAAEHVETLPNATRWLLCSSLAGYFLLSGLVWLGKAGREQR
ncbi:hypothetical protein [Streptomyces hokutonensis]|uniref:hypothetical protein n=1 Tax=Streptomyces hokutonensis TaxID=1306990 RepID=UPI0037FAC2A3